MRECLNLTSIKELRREVDIIQKALFGSYDPQAEQRAKETIRVLREYEESLNEAVAHLTEQDVKGFQAELSFLEQQPSNPDLNPDPNYEKAIHMAHLRNLISHYYSGRFKEEVEA